MYQDTPKIYESGVSYIYKDSIEAPAWQDVATCIAKKTGDCKDFAAWRCAELLEQGVACRPVIQWRKVGDAYRFHALVLYQDGTLEDPSKLLGMQTDAPFITPPDVDPFPGKDFSSNEIDRDTMDANKTADAVVRGLILGDAETKQRAKDSYQKLAEMADSDPECAKAISAVRRACGYVRNAVASGASGENIAGLVEYALNPSRRSRSILVPDNVRGIGVYQATRGDNVNELLGLTEREEGEISAPVQAVLSIIPGINLLAPLTPQAVKGADDLITKAQGGDKAALGKITDTKAKAAAGDPQAKADLDALQRVKKAKDVAKGATIDAYAPKSWWPWDLYHAGVGTVLH